jgi:hypothetical protein
MTGNEIFYERLSSNRTEALFLVLTFLFFRLHRRRYNRADRLDLFAALFFILFVFFGFCSLNYRTLIIRLTEEKLTLIFGLFRWRVPLHNVAECRRDELPLFMRLGGAGIHFMFIRKRYRVSFNFLEYPRILIRLKRKVGPVEDVSFSTRRPDEFLQIIQEIRPIHC